MNLGLPEIKLTLPEMNLGLPEIKLTLPEMNVDFPERNLTSDVRRLCHCQTCHNSGNQPYFVPKMQHPWDS